MRGGLFRYVALPGNPAIVNHFPAYTPRFTTPSNLMNRNNNSVTPCKEHAFRRAVSPAKRILTFSAHVTAFKLWMMLQKR